MVLLGEIELTFLLPLALEFLHEFLGRRGRELLDQLSQEFSVQETHN